MTWLAPWLVGLGGLGMVVVAGGCASSAAPVAAQAPETSEQAFRRVRPAVAFEMLRDSPSLLVLDLRDTKAFRGPSGRLSRALNYPLAELPESVAALKRYHELTFLVYCDTEECAVQGMRTLAEHGCRRAVLIDGGIAAWKKSGLGTVHSELAE